MADTNPDHMRLVIDTLWLWIPPILAAIVVARFLWLDFLREPHGPPPAHGRLTEMTIRAIAARQAPQPLTSRTLSQAAHVSRDYASERLSDLYLQGRCEIVLEEKAAGGEVAYRFPAQEEEL